MLVVTALFIIVVDGGNDGDGVGVVGTLIDLAVSPSTVMVPIDVEFGDVVNPTKFPSSSSCFKSTLSTMVDSDMVVVCAAFLIIVASEGGNDGDRVAAMALSSASFKVNLNVCSMSRARSVRASMFFKTISNPVLFRS